ncbi:hypothetical protein N1030_04290 [Desulfovibrio mangrovi]|uniref:hypothetical protein n=1 Tax=Desulfovibrio mangrovi TaxID=2976983 RepID=UPI00224517C4|nr:hypothetical protein [Desulfovibrio mangrovi]UZP68205.1 hypothetical protein N1030_04290 [Desulfovibrio mangrovi]
MLPPSRLLALEHDLILPLPETAMDKAIQSMLPARLRIGIASHSVPLLHQLTIADNIALPALYKRLETGKTINKRVQALLQTEGLDTLAHCFPLSVTREILIRTSMLRCIMNESRVIVLDTRSCMDRSILEAAIVMRDRHAAGTRIWILCTPEYAQSLHDLPFHVASGAL